MAIKGSVPESGVIVPHLVVRSAAAAVEFYEPAFSAVVYSARCRPMETGNIST